jgi:hypothetical protein
MKRLSLLLLLVASADRALAGGASFFPPADFRKTGGDVSAVSDFLVGLESSSRFQATHLGSAVNDVTQDAITIRPGGALSANYRGWSVYASSVATAPVTYTGQAQTFGGVAYQHGSLFVSDGVKTAILGKESGSDYFDFAADGGDISIYLPNSANTETILMGPTYDGMEAFSEDGTSLWRNQTGLARVFSDTGTAEVVAGTDFSNLSAYSTGQVSVVARGPGGGVGFLQLESVNSFALLKGAANVTLESSGADIVFSPGSSFARPISDAVYNLGTPSFSWLNFYTRGIITNAATGASDGIVVNTVNDPLVVARFYVNSVPRGMISGAQPASVAGNGTTAESTAWYTAKGGNTTGTTGQTAGGGGHGILQGGDGGDAPGGSTNGFGGNVQLNPGGAGAGAGAAGLAGKVAVSPLSGAVAAAMELAGGTAPSVSAGSTADIYFDSTSLTFKTSLNGGAYQEPFKTVYGFGATGVIAGGLTRYALLGSDLPATTNDLRHPVPAGIAKNLRVNLGTAPGVGETITVTVQQNGVNGIMTCTVTGAATTCTDTANATTFAAGDTISVELTTSALAAPANVAVSFEQHF